MSVESVVKAAIKASEACGCEYVAHSTHGVQVAVVVKKDGREWVMTFRESQSCQSVTWAAESSLKRVGFLREYTLTREQLLELFEAGRNYGFGGGDTMEEEFNRALEAIKK